MSDEKWLLEDEQLEWLLEDEQLLWNSANKLLRLTDDAHALTVGVLLSRLADLRQRLAEARKQERKFMEALGKDGGR